MWRDQGPNYREWLGIIEHNADLDFEGLKAIAERIETEPGRLSEAQRGELLRRIGDLQIQAANRPSVFSHREPLTGPSGS